MRTTTLAAAAVAALGLTPAAARTLTSDDLALGASKLAAPITLKPGKAAAVLSIKGVEFPKGEPARALLEGVLSVRNPAATGTALVQLSIREDGVEEPAVFSQTVPHGASATVSLICPSIVEAGGSHGYDLLVRVTGDAVSAQAGTFAVIALRPVATPPG